MPFLRFSRDKRGYEHFYLVEPTNRGGRSRQQILYWFRTPPGVKVGRPPFDAQIQRALEAQYPQVSFDWKMLLATPIPPPTPDVEHWRERRRAAKAAKQAAAMEAAAEATADTSQDEQATEEMALAEPHEGETPPPADQSTQPSAPPEGGRKRRRRRHRRGRSAVAAQPPGESMPTVTDTSEPTPEPTEE